MVTSPFLISFQAWRAFVVIIIEMVLFVSADAARHNQWFGAIGFAAVAVRLIVKYRPVFLRLARAAQYLCGQA